MNVAEIAVANMRSDTLVHCCDTGHTLSIVTVLFQYLVHRFVGDNRERSVPYVVVRVVYHGIASIVCHYSLHCPLNMPPPLPPTHIPAQISGSSGKYTFIEKCKEDYVYADNFLRPPAKIRSGLFISQPLHDILASPP